MTSNLVLPLAGVYFDEIRAGVKLEEFRLATRYWRVRLEGRTYDQLVLTRGYPPRDDAERRLVLPWRGCYRKLVLHPHFGPEPVEVYALPVSLRRYRRTPFLPLPELASQRRPYRCLMHVSDAGGVLVRYACHRCGHETDWMTFLTITETKYGIPCPNCDNEHAGAGDTGRPYTGAVEGGSRCVEITAP